MKIKHTLITLLLILFANSTLAANKIFELEEIRSYPMSTYPNLNLTGTEKIKIVTDRAATMEETKLLRLEIHFENANPLIATSFVKSEDKYRAIVKNAWIYRNLVVDVYRSPLVSFADPIIRVHVGESNELINSADTNLGVMIYEAGGIMRDITPNRIVDKETYTFQGKKAVSKLYKYESSNTQGSVRGHVIESIYDNSTNVVHINLPFNAEALSLEIQEIEEGFPEYSVKYKHSDGIIEQTPFTSVYELLNNPY